MTRETAVNAIAEVAPGILPGWALMITLATACYVLPDLLSPHMAIGGKSPVEPVPNRSEARHPQFFILIAMAGIGLNTRIGAMRKVGGIPLVVAFVGALSLGVISYTLIRGLGLGG